MKIFLKIFQWASRMQIWRTSGFFSATDRMFFAHCPNVREKNFSCGNNFPQRSKNSYAHVKCSFDNPDGVFVPGVGQFFALSPKILGKVFFFKQKFFSSKCSRGDVDHLLDDAVKKFLTKADSFLRIVQKRVSKNFFLEKKQEVLFKIYCGHAKCSFDNPFEEISTKGWKFIFLCPKVIIKCPQKTFFRSNVQNES